MTINWRQFGKEPPQEDRQILWMALEPIDDPGLFPAETRPPRPLVGAWLSVHAGMWAEGKLWDPSGGPMSVSDLARAMESGAWCYVVDLVGVLDPGVFGPGIVCPEGIGFVAVSGDDSVTVMVGSSVAA